MKPLKLILAAVLGLAVVVSGYSAEQKKENKDKVVKGRVIQLPVSVTDIDKNPIMEARVHINNNNINAFYTNEMGVVTIHVYDYNTDQEIGLDAVSSVQQQEMESAVSGILADLQNITVEQSETNDTVLSLNVAIDSPYSTDLAVCAEHFYYDSLQFIVQYLTLDPLPYQNLAFNIVIDGEDVGSMVMFSAPEVGLIGTTTPIIADEEVLQVFSEKYDELMGEVDQSNFTK